MKVQPVNPGFQTPAPKRSAKTAAVDSYTPAERHMQDVRFNRALRVSGYMGWNLSENSNSMGAITERSGGTARNILMSAGAASGVGWAIGTQQGVMEAVGLGVAGAALGFGLGLAYIFCSREAPLNCPEQIRPKFN